MDTLEAIHSRTSVKAFRSEPVERGVIEQILDAAIRAPNHRLTEPWSFYVLTGGAKRRLAELRREHRAKKYPDPEAPEVEPALRKAYEDVIETPAVIAVTTLVADDPVQREEDYAATYCAIQNMLLAATALGLGTYLRTGAIMDDERLAQLLALPEEQRVVGLIYLGYPAEEGKHKPRIAAAEKTRWLS